VSHLRVVIAGSGNLDRFIDAGGLYSVGRLYSIGVFSYIVVEEGSYINLVGYLINITLLTASIVGIT